MKAATYFIAAILLNTQVEAEQMPVARIDDRRKLFEVDTSCKVVTCHFPYWFSFEKCGCVPTF